MHACMQQVEGEHVRGSMCVYDCACIIVRI